MKVQEIIDLLISDYAKGIPSDDTRLRPRRVYSALKNARATILSDRNARSEYNYTTLPCVGITKVNAVECSCVEVKGCYYYKTDCQLPAGLGDYDSSIKDVTTLDGSVRFSKIDWSRVKDSQYDRFTANKPRYFIRNGYIYLIHVPALLEVITIRGIFEDPVSIDCFLCDEDSTLCDPLDRDFPLERRYVDPVLKLAYQQLFALQTTEDKIDNNAEDQ